MSPELMTITTTLGLYAVAVVSPGPNFALISRLAVSGKRQTAIRAALGLAIAATVYALLTMMGLALILFRIGWLARLMQISGGCYLVYLGITAWLAATPLTAVKQTRLLPDSPLRGLQMGMLVGLSNPKGIAFFVSLYAVSIPLGTPLWAKMVILVGGALLEILWYSFVAILLSHRRATTVYDQFRSWIERAIGTVLVVCGLRLISEKL
jgi:threonine/homoserine/homoserine lactone efflux protein